MLYIFLMIGNRISSLIYKFIIDVVEIGITIFLDVLFYKLKYVYLALNILFSTGLLSLPS